MKILLGYDGNERFEISDDKHTLHVPNRNSTKKFHKVMQNVLETAMGNRQDISDTKWWSQGRQALGEDIQVLGEICDDNMLMVVDMEKDAWTGGSNPQMRSEMRKLRHHAEYAIKNSIHGDTTWLSDVNDFVPKTGPGTYQAIYIRTSNLEISSADEIYQIFNCADIGGRTYEIRDIDTKVDIAATMVPDLLVQKLRRVGFKNATYVPEEGKVLVELGNGVLFYFYNRIQAKLLMDSVRKPVGTETHAFLNADDHDEYALLTNPSVVANGCTRLEARIKMLDFNPESGSYEPIVANEKYLDYAERQGLLETILEKALAPEEDHEEPFFLTSISEHILAMDLKIQEEETPTVFFVLDPTVMEERRKAEEAVKKKHEKEQTIGEIGSLLIPVGAKTAVDFNGIDAMDWMVAWSFVKGKGNTKRLQGAWGTGGFPTLSAFLKAYIPTNVSIVGLVIHPNTGFAARRADPPLPMYTTTRAHMVKFEREILSGDLSDIKMHVKWPGKKGNPASFDPFRPPVDRSRGDKRRSHLPKQPRKKWSSILDSFHATDEVTTVAADKAAADKAAEAFSAQFKHFRFADWPHGPAGIATLEQFATVSLRRMNGRKGTSLKRDMAKAREYAHLAAIVGDKRTQAACEDGQFPAPDAKREREAQGLPFGKLRKFLETKDALNDNDITAAKYVPVDIWFTVTAHVPDYNHGFAVQLKELNVEASSQAWANLPSFYVPKVEGWLARGDTVQLRSIGAANQYFNVPGKKTGTTKRKCVPKVDIKRV